MDKKRFTGAALVVIGASCYGGLGTIVELAYQAGYTVYEVTVSQYVWGVIALCPVYAVKKIRFRGKPSVKPSSWQSVKLVLSGIPIALAGLCYYLAIETIPVSVSVVLIMQTIWMSVVVEAAVKKEFPTPIKLAAILIILVGTLLATDAVNHMRQLDLGGVLWGLAGAGCYTFFLVAANGVESCLDSTVRSFHMVVGATLTVLVAALPHLCSQFNLSIFMSWGLPLAIFGPILPPLLFNVGLPRTGVGLGSILGSIEIPVSIGIAYLLLNQQVVVEQWIGVSLILLAVVCINGKDITGRSLAVAEHKAR